MTSRRNDNAIRGVIYATIWLVCTAMIVGVAVWAFAILTAEPASMEQTRVVSAPVVTVTPTQTPEPVATVAPVAVDIPTPVTESVPVTPVDPASVFTVDGMDGIVTISDTTGYSLEMNASCAKLIYDSGAASIGDAMLAIESQPEYAEACSS